MRACFALPASRADIKRWLQKLSASSLPISLMPTWTKSIGRAWIAIADGIHRPQDIDGAELGESIRLALCDHDQQQSRFRISSLEELADWVEIQPVIQVELRKIRDLLDDQLL